MLPPSSLASSRLSSDPPHFAALTPPQLAWIQAGALNLRAPLRAHDGGRGDGEEGTVVPVAQGLSPHRALTAEGVQTPLHHLPL